MSEVEIENPFDEKSVPVGTEGVARVYTCCNAGDWTSCGEVNRKGG